MSLSTTSPAHDAAARAPLGRLVIPVALAALGAALLLGCSPDDGEPGPTPAGEHAAPVHPEQIPLFETRSADARLSTHRMLEEDLATTADPSDGGGRFELVLAEPLSGPGPIEVGTPARFELRYVAGPLGVQVGGMLFLQPSPFWDWSPPQTQQPGAPGFTIAECDAEGVELELGPPAGGVVAVVIRGRALAENETVRFVYGAGERGALVDRYAERGAEISLFVDGDGDGYRKLVDPGARVDVVAGPPAQIIALGPTVVRPGERFSVRASVLDAMGNAGTRTAGGLVFEALAERGSAGLEARHALRIDAPAAAKIEWVAPAEPGVLRIEVRGEGALEGLSATTNPIVVHATAQRVLWGDLHGHSQLSDGTGTPDDYFSYARDVAGLDVSALTDHDHWGLRFLDSHPEHWDGIKQAVSRHHAPGSFVTLLGYEWTSWLHGHRHVLYFEDDGPVLSSLDPAYQNPAQLWEGLRGHSALTFAHHSAGGPVSTNWAFGADPEFEPVTEIVSVHGSSESEDTPDRIYSPVPGNTVRDVLMAGLRLGFIGSGDSHDGHPGLAQLASPMRSAGLAAILAEDRTRASVLTALRGRQTYATNGARIWLNVDLDGHSMGQSLPAQTKASEEQTLRIDVVGTADIDRIDLIRTGRIATLNGFEGSEAVVERQLPRLAPGEWHYVRVVQTDGGVAWSSPIFAD